MEATAPKGELAGQLPGPGRVALGERLVRAGLIDQNTLAQALNLQRQRNRRLGEVLVEQGWLSSSLLASVLSHHLNLPVADLRFVVIDPKAVELVPMQLAQRYLALPLELRGNRLVIAMADPEDLRAITDLESHTGLAMEVRIAAHDQLREAIDAHYRGIAVLEPARTSGPAPADGPSAVKVVENLLQQALRDHASDIHIEPQDGRLRVRLRVDGMLREVAALPLSLHDAMLSRLKVLASLNIAERRLPQDGQFSFRQGSQEVDVRLATAETVYGEMAVLRILERSSQLLELGNLGLQPAMLERYLALLRSAHGMILVSGPTGSGKTTTLYASLSRIDRQRLNVLTIEDPVEYRFPDINPIQVKEQVGATFARSLRAALRLDPDVMLIGEVRDRETAQIAIQAALTGHLVLTSIHANDSVGVPFRLLDLGVEPFLLTAAVIGIVGQRMVRKVCRHCAEEAPATVEEQIAFARYGGEERARFVRGRGCVYCGGAGFLGRMGVFELLVPDEQLKSMMLRGSDAQTIRRYIEERGGVSMLRDGMNKAAAGLTTPLEVLRAVYSADQEPGTQQAPSEEP